MFYAIFSGSWWWLDESDKFNINYLNEIERAARPEKVATYFTERDSSTLKSRLNISEAL